MNYEKNALPNDPVEEAFIEIAIGVQKPKSLAEGLLIFANRMKPKPSLQEAEDFRDFWIEKKDKFKGFPQFYEFKDWLYSTGRRKDPKKSVDEKDCYFHLCDGTGYVSLKPIGHSDDTDHIRGGKFCKCYKGLGPDRFHELEDSGWEVTSYQNDVHKTKTAVRENKAKQSSFIKSKTEEYTKNPKTL
jgi:hypothetical protein